MLPKYGNCMRLLKIWLKIKSKLKIGFFFFSNKVGKNSRYFLGVFNKTIIPLALVGYEMTIANSALRTSLATYHLISNAQKGQKWNNAPTRPCVKYRQVTIVIHNKTLSTQEFLQTSFPSWIPNFLLYVPT